MDVCEPCIQEGEMSNWKLSVLMNFGSLTLRTGAGPLPDILVDAWPHVMGGDHPLCGLNSWV